MSQAGRFGIFASVSLFSLYSLGKQHLQNYKTQPRGYTFEVCSHKTAL